MTPHRKESAAWTFYQDRLKKENWPKDDLCDPPTTDREALDTLTDRLLGPDWYVTMPETQEQTNTVAVYSILQKYVDRSRSSGIIRFLLGFILGLLAYRLVF